MAKRRAKKPTDEFRAELKAYSPDSIPMTYRLVFTPTKFALSRGMRIVECTRDDKGTLIWTYNDGAYEEHPLFVMFAIERIYPPSIVPLALKAAWGKWRSGNVSKDVLERGLRKLFKWISKTAITTADGPLWQEVF